MSFLIGEYIRQMRRQKGLTQAELGIEEFSKSYISAVERGQIVPSRNALRFFAKRLDQSVESLEELLQPPQQELTLSSVPELRLNGMTESVYNDQEVVALLDLALQGKDMAVNGVADYSDMQLDPGTLLSLQKRARYAFLKGIQAQEQMNFSTAQSDLEYALVLAPDEYKSAILDSLGTNAYHVQAYEQALTYYLRARSCFQMMQPTSSDQLFQIELHCGNASRVLGYYQHAQEHYRQARKQLRSTHNMQIAGQLYLGLGYSVYAALYQVQRSASVSIGSLSAEEIERQFQQSLSFLMQSRTLYQIGSDWNGETQARLTQAMVLLDLCVWRQQQAVPRKQVGGSTIIVNCASLFDEIDEQCRQILLGLLEKYQEFTPLPIEQENIAYLTLAYLIRTLSRRASVAQLGGYIDTAVRERSLAFSLCLKVLNALPDTTLSLALIRDAINMSGHSATTAAPSLLTLPDVSIMEVTSRFTPFILAETYFAIGEMSEEIAKNTAGQDFATRCYNVADQCFSRALVLDVEHVRGMADENEPNYFVRLSQRYTDVLEQRLSVSFIPGKETAERSLALLKGMLRQLPQTKLSFPEHIYQQYQ